MSEEYTLRTLLIRALQNHPMATTSGLTHLLNKDWKEVSTELCSMFDDKVLNCVILPDGQSAYLIRKKKYKQLPLWPE